ncbi:hypothetical protein O6H91_Y079300 [Diphasiastrum complanatum]|nr:hypothetical protein O6H91_Y079300 [Diphasiastrum complanatum]
MRITEEQGLLSGRGRIQKQDHNHNETETKAVIRRSRAGIARREAFPDNGSQIRREILTWIARSKQRIGLFCSFLFTRSCHLSLSLDLDLSLSFCNISHGQLAARQDAGTCVRISIHACMHPATHPSHIPITFHGHSTYIYRDGEWAAIHAMRCNAHTVSVGKSACQVSQAVRRPLPALGRAGSVHRQSTLTAAARTQTGSG